MSNVTLMIDGESVTVAQGATILQAAQLVRKQIPTICYHPHFTAPSLCRMCVVEVDKSRVLVQACSRPCENGMVVHTDTERVRLSRRLILEMLHSAVDTSESPDIQRYSTQYAADPQRFGDVPRRRSPLYDDNPFYVRDYDKCILCWRCVQACGEDVQWTFAISRGGRGFESYITTFEQVPIPQSTCVYCGNCVQACPTGALKAKRELFMEEGLDLQMLARVSQIDRAENK